jgi:hypothetical protein
MVRQIKQQMRAVDARPIKKIAEAKGKKKLKVRLAASRLARGAGGR